MSNPAAIIALRYKQSDDVSFTDLQTNPIGLFFWIERGLWEPAEVRGRDDVLLGAAGRQRRNRVRDRRRIIVRGVVLGDGATLSDQLTDYQTAMQDLRDLLDPTDYGVLQADLNDGTTLEINAWPLPDWGVAEIGPTASALTIGFESVDPDWAVASS